VGKALQQKIEERSKAEQVLFRDRLSAGRDSAIDLFNIVISDPRKRVVDRALCCAKPVL
jgi:hypothetical protein